MMFYIPKKYVIMLSIFNPYDIEDMAKAICKVVADESLRKNLIKRGKERIKFFGSENAIDQHVKLYKELSKNRK